MFHFLIDLSIPSVRVLHAFQLCMHSNYWIFFSAGFFVCMMLFNLALKDFKWQMRFGQNKYCGLFSVTKGSNFCFEEKAMGISSGISS